MAVERTDTGLDLSRCRALAKKIRQDVVRMTHRAKSSHVGTSLSMADLLAVLYGGAMRVKPGHPDWPDRDRFILSKGHGCAAVYAVLAEIGFFPFKWVLDTFNRDGSLLAGHISHAGVPGVEASTGSLGHGLSIACGMALAGKREGKPYRVFAMLSDGECDEGSTWEAVLFAPHHDLSNLIAIVDYNKIQSLGRVEEVLSLDPLSEKWKAFGWSVQEIDGHDVSQIENALRAAQVETHRPSCIIAHTIKGKGVSFMENKLVWHYKPPNDEDLRQALLELGSPE